MTAEEFNANHTVGCRMVYDPAPLLGEPQVKVILSAEAFDDGDPDFPIAKAMVRRVDEETAELVVPVEYLTAE